jgi:O-antigen ligase
MEAHPRSAAGRRAKSYTAAVVLGAIALSAVLGVLLVRLGTVQRDLKAILIIVAAIAMATAALRPELGLIMLMALIPFEFSFSGTGTDEVLIVAMALVLVWRIQAKTIPAWLSFAGGALIFGSFIAAVGASDRTSALWGGVRWLSVIVILFAALSILRNRQDASRRMTSIFLGAAVIVVAFGFVQMAGIHLLVGASFTPGHPSSFFGYYTNYADYVAVAAILATGEVLSSIEEGRSDRAAICGAVLVFMLVGVAISASRGGLLALGGGWLVLLILNVRRGSIFVRTTALIVAFTVAGYVVTPHSTIVKIEHRFTKPLGSLEEDRIRFALEEAGEQALWQHPFGIGYANFENYLRTSVRGLNIRRLEAHAQNTPIQMGLDAGWLGGVGFLMLVIWPIGLVLTSRNRGPSSVRASAFAAALGGFMAQNLFDYMFYEIAFLVFVLALVWGAIHALSVEEMIGWSPLSARARVLSATTSSNT